MIFLVQKIQKLLLPFIVMVFLALSINAFALPPLGTMSISWPINRSVFQRNSSNQANVFFAGQFFYNDQVDCAALDFFYKIQKRTLDTGAPNGDQVGWTQYFLANTNTGVFNSTISNLPAGWYDLQVKATTGGVSGTVAATATIIFGVGDVFVVAGQSNAQSPGIADGFNSNTMLTSDSWDCVNVHNYDGACKPETDQLPTMVKLINQANPSFRTGPSGFNSWYYAPLGKQIAENYGVPTAFFNAAMGGTTVENWSLGAQNLATGWAGAPACQNYNPSIPAADALGQPYRSLKNILKYYAKIFGVKAVLWHQGESDNVANTTAADYQSRLQVVVNQSRTDFGSSNLTWFVARVSYVSVSNTTDANVISGQNNIIAVAGNNVKAGPSTDGINGSTKRYDGLHFFQGGLTDAATLWRNSIYATTSNLFSASTPPIASFQTGLPGYPIQAAAGYSVYNWNSRVAPSATTQTAYVNGRCFVKDSNGNWLITPEYISGAFCGLSGGRLSAETPQENINSSFNFFIGSNPVTDQSSNITFTMPYQANVRLEVIDLSGNSVKKLAEGSHAPGRYNYPIWLQNAPSGTYICNLQVDGISMSKKFVFVK